MKFHLEMTQWTFFGQNKANDVPSTVIMTQHYYVAASASG